MSYFPLSFMSGRDLLRSYCRWEAVLFEYYFRLRLSPCFSSWFNSGKHHLLVRRCMFLLFSTLLHFTCFQLIRRKRFEECIRKEKPKVLDPIVIRRKGTGVEICNEQCLLADTYAAIKSMDSVKLHSDDMVITLNEEGGVIDPETNDLVKDIVADNFALKDCVEAILAMVGKAGVVGTLQLFL